MLELMDKVKGDCQNTDTENYNTNLMSLLEHLQSFKDRGGKKEQARNALLKVAYNFSNEDLDLAADCVNDALKIIDGENKDIAPIW